MAVPAILDLPTLALTQIERVRFHAPPIGALSQSAAGEITFQEKVGGNLWSAAWVTNALNERDFGTWHAFWLAAVTRKFKAFDPRRCQPIAYSAAALAALGGGYDGSVSVTAAGGNTLNLGGLKPGLALNPGDYISFPWRGTQELVYVLEAKVANVSGLIAGITVHPWLIAGGTLPAAGTLVRPWCYMKMQLDSWSGERGNRDPISFESVQDKTPNA